MGVADTGTLHHTCFVVYNVDRAAQSLADRLSMGPWQVWTLEPHSSTVRGKDTRYSFRIAIAQVGGSNYELIAPEKGDSVFREHLKEKGEGFHHTCIAYPTWEALHAARDILEEQGRRMIQSGSFGDIGEFYYYEIAETGAILELLYLKELPPPEKTIELSGEAR